MRLFLIACLSISSFATPFPEGKLPNEVVPRHYKLDLTVNPRKDTFSGKVQIRIAIQEKLKQFWIHGEGLQVRRAALKTDQELIPAKYRQVSDQGVALIELSQEVIPGEATLEMDYSATYPKDLYGLYRVKQGPHTYVYSQFEPMGARLCFPSFDEPRFKTPFEISLTVPKTDHAISNGAESKIFLRNKQQKTVHFAATQPLPTYLVAFAVGPFNIVKARAPSSVALRGVAPQGRGRELAYALEETPKILAILEDYFGIPYPFGKLDILAVPDFAAGAMENPGAITFRDSLLLMDPKTAPVKQIRSFAEVMAHELAHQWFGNLVTMNWWDDLWLNEAFATWMATKTMMTYRPLDHVDWDAIAHTQYAMDEDSLRAARRIGEPIQSYHDVYSAFDSITYTKGAAIIRMFENWVTPPVFRAGVQQYLNEHAYRTATTQDFIEAISSASSQDLDKPWRSFLNQVGVPLIDLNETGYQQSRYLPLGSELSQDQVWLVPYCSSSEPCFLLNRKMRVWSLPGFPQKNGIGYYRFAGKPQFQPEQLNEAEKIAWVYNLQAQYRAGKLDTSSLLEQLRGFAGDSNRYLSTAPMGTLSWLKEYLNPPGLQAFAARLYSKKPQSSEPDEQTLIDAKYFEFMAFTVEDASIRQKLMKDALRYLAKDRRVNRNFLRIALRVLAQEKPDSVKALQEQLFQSQDAQERSALISAIAESDAALPLLFSPKLRKNEILTLLASYMNDTEHHETGLQWFQKNSPELLKRLPKKGSGHLPSIFSSLCSKEHAIRVKELLSSAVEKLPGGPRALENTLESIQLCAAQKEFHRSDALKFFKQM